MYLDLVRQAPFFTDVNDTLTTGSTGAAHLTLVVADEPEVAVACTTALMSGNDAAACPGAQPHRRGDPPPDQVGIGPDADPHDRLRAGDDVLTARSSRPAADAFTYRPDRRPADLSWSV